jgi:hypothetical protein
MTVQDMHLDFKRKLNKVDSQHNTNFTVPYIDQYLNEAQEIFIKQRLQTNNIYREGFEVSQKRIEDLRRLVKKFPIDSPAIVANKISDFIYEIELPSDYLYYIRSEITAKKEECTKSLSGIEQQHDDLNTILSSKFYSPSFEWRETPIVFSDNSIYIYSDGTFEVLNLNLDYIRRPKLIANPDNYIKVDNTTGYNYPDGTPAIQQDCEIDSMFSQREIVDIAVEIAAIDLGDQRFSLMQTKTKINE